MPKKITFRRALAEGRDVFFMASAGMLDDAFVVNIFGRNSNMGLTEQTVWRAGGLYPFDAFSAGGTLSIVSDNSADSLTASGGRTLRLSGLGTDYNVVTEDIEMDGLTPVTTENTFIRLNKMTLLTAGASGEVGGTISASINGSVVGTVTDGDNESLSTVYTIPASYTGYISMGQSSVGKGKDVSFSFFVRPYGGVFGKKHVADLYQDTYNYNFQSPLAIPPKTDLEVRGVSSASSTPMSAVYDIILVKDL